MILVDGIGQQTWAGRHCQMRFPITWDLKGSMVGRQSGTEKRAQKDRTTILPYPYISIHILSDALDVICLENLESSAIRCRK
jgi:hypothetical protein